MPRITANQIPRRPKSIPADEPIDSSETTVAVVDPPSPEPPKTPPPPASELIREQIERERIAAECREELVFRRHQLLADGGELSPSEMRILQYAVPRGANESDYEYNQRFAMFLHKEETRVCRILDLQSASGVPRDRKVADEAATVAEAKLESEGPPLLAEIERLEGKLRKLQHEADTKRAAAESRRVAVANLRDDQLLPAFVRDEIASARRENVADFKRELLTLETRKRQIEGALSLNPASSVDLECIKHLVAPHKTTDERGTRELEEYFHCETVQAAAHKSFRVGKLRLDRWNEYCASLREELDLVEKRILEITNGAKAEADAKLEQMRSYYVPK